MALPEYPASDMDQGRLLLQQLGSFWFNVFGDRAIVQTQMQANAHAQAQNHLNYLEAVAAVSRFNVPVFHVENWHLLTIKLSEVKATASLYGPDDLIYSGTVASAKRTAGFVQSYGGQDTPGQIIIELPGTLANVRFTIHNKVALPTRNLVAGLDFEVDVANRRLHFRSNLFEDSLFAKRDIYDATGVKIDEEISCWIYKGEFDLEYVYEHFGYAIGMRYKSSEEYKQLLNAVWNMFVTGATRDNLILFLSSMAGVPYILEPQETIERVWSEADRKLLATDHNVYTFPLTATLLYDNSDAGTILFYGAQLSDTIQTSELTQNDGDYPILPSMALGSSLLAGEFLSEIVLRNTTVALDYVGLDANNKAIVRFEANGFPLDVEAFWSDVHARGTAVGKVLADYLDLRSEPESPPVPDTLPPFINPLKFIVDNLMHNNLFAIRLKVSGFNPRAPGLSAFRFLRDVIPPHTTYLVFIDLNVVDTIDLSQAGGEDAPGTVETLAIFNGATPFVETYSGASDVYVKAALVSVTCQE